MVAKKFQKFKSSKTNEKGLKLDVESVVREMLNSVVYRMRTYFLKESFYALLCYAILSHAMVWYGKYGTCILWDFDAMPWDFYAILCFAMVFVVKDKHTATVFINQSMALKRSCLLINGFKVAYIHHILSPKRKSTGF